MNDLNDGESVEMKGSGKKPYVLKNTGGVYSCSCPAWRNQSFPIERRTCKHLKKLRGVDEEASRLGSMVEPVKEKEEKAVPALLLAHKWENEVDLAGWWISEKLDGVRAYWDGENFISRQGNLYHAPDWFKKNLPAIPLDGELWVDRGEFQKCVSIVRRQDKNDEWEQVKFLVFDAPSIDLPFEERLEHIRLLEQESASMYWSPLKHYKCEGLAHLKEELKRVEDKGGEGLMLREPKSKYESGRSNTLLKVKSFHDADAVVLDHLPGKGRHKGRLGAIAVRASDGVMFSIGSGFSDKQREAPPKIGSKVIYRFQELTKDGVPRFPVFVGERAEQ